MVYQIARQYEQARTAQELQLKKIVLSLNLIKNELDDTHKDTMDVIISHINSVIEYRPGQTKGQSVSDMIIRESIEIKRELTCASSKLSTLNFDAGTFSTGTGIAIDAICNQIKTLQ